MRAVLSVADKTGIVEFARGLSDLGYELVATGRTAATLSDSGLPVREVAEVTGFPELLGGRVKTLHPAIAAGILARRDDPADQADLATHAITPVDLVVCNLYPFGQAIARPETTLAQALDEIDIGGVTLLRAAAKNFAHVAVVVRPEDYPRILEALRTGGTLEEGLRRQLAARAFAHTAHYDALVAAYLRAGSAEEQFPDELTLGLRRLQTLRYGENPHQSAALYTWCASPEAAQAHAATPEPQTATLAGTPRLAGARLLHGKELSFNNLLDLDAALGTIASFAVPSAVVIKHTNPCGLACGDTLAEAYRRAHAGDPVSAYGGVVGFNRPVDEATAIEVAQIFYEAVLAPEFSPAALDLLGQRKNLRLVATGAPIGPATVADHGDDFYRLDVRRVSGGFLVQTPDVVSDHEVRCTVVTEREPTLEEVTDLLFAWKAVRHVKSNAVVLAKRLMLVGVGAGQTSRVYSVQIAVDRAADRARGSVLASDAYFPFPDGVEAAAKAGVTAIIQPGGSIRDGEAIRMANRYGLAMIMTGQRHFRH